MAAEHTARELLILTPRPPLNRTGLPSCDLPGRNRSVMSRESSRPPNSMPYRPPIPPAALDHTRTSCDPAILRARRKQRRGKVWPRRKSWPMRTELLPATRLSALLQDTTCLINAERRLLLPTNAVELEAPNNADRTAFATWTSRTLAMRTSLAKCGTRLLLSTMWRLALPACRRPTCHIQQHR